MNDDFDGCWDAEDFEAVERVRARRRSIIRTPEQRIEKTWNGNPVKSMESDHIMNAILFCEKKFAEAYRNYETCYGEGFPPFYFDSVSDMFPEYMNLRNEWMTRLGK